MSGGTRTLRPGGPGGPGSPAAPGGPLKCKQAVDMLSVMNYTYHCVWSVI